MSVVGGSVSSVNWKDSDSDCEVLTSSGGCKGHRSQRSSDRVDKLRACTAAGDIEATIAVAVFVEGLSNVPLASRRGINIK